MDSDERIRLRSALAETVRDRRERLGMTVRQLSEVCGLPVQVIAAIEAGEEIEFECEEAGSHVAARPRTSGRPPGGRAPEVPTGRPVQRRSRLSHEVSPKTGTDPADKEAQRRFGLRLRQLRDEQGLSVDELAARAAILPRHITAFEDGLREPSIFELFVLTRALDRESVRDLLEGIGLDVEIDRTMARILRTLALTRDGQLSASELSRRLGLPTTVVQRALRRLESAGCVTSNADSPLQAKASGPERVPAYQPTDRGVELAYQALHRHGFGGKATPELAYLFAPLHSRSSRAS